MVQPKLSIIGLHVALPDFLAVHREANHFTVARGDPDHPTVRDCGRRSGVLLAEKLVAAIDLVFPLYSSVLAVDGQKKDFVWNSTFRSAAWTPFAQVQKALFRRGYKDGLLPDYRRRGAPTWQLCAPQNVLRLRPTVWKAGCGRSTTVRVRAAPLRPICGRTYREPKSKCQENSTKEAALHIKSRLSRYPSLSPGACFVRQLVQTW